MAELRDFWRRISGWLWLPLVGLLLCSRFAPLLMSAGAGGSGLSSNWNSKAGPDGLLQGAMITVGRQGSPYSGGGGGVSGSDGPPPLYPAKHFGNLSPPQQQQQPPPIGLPQVVVHSPAPTLQRSLSRLHSHSNWPPPFSLDTGSGGGGGSGGTGNSSLAALEPTEHFSPKRRSPTARSSLSSKLWTSARLFLRSPVHAKRTTPSFRWLTCGLLLLLLTVMALMFLRSDSSTGISNGIVSFGGAGGGGLTRGGTRPRSDPITEIRHPLAVVGVAGGSGSGKSTLVDRTVNLLHSVGIRSAVLHLDNYYRDLSHMSPEDRAKVNFDHPEAIDFELINEHLQLLLQGRPIERPFYDFATHARDPSRGLTMTPKLPAPDGSLVWAWDVLLLDGILALHHPAVRRLLDVAVFVEASPETRLARRIARDTVQRGRTEESVRAQFFTTVEPMHQRFVEPGRSQASIRINTEIESHSQQGLRQFVRRLLDLVYERKSSLLEAWSP